MSKEKKQVSVLEIFDADKEKYKKHYRDLRKSDCNEFEHESNIVRVGAKWRAEERKITIYKENNIIALTTAVLAIIAVALSIAQGFEGGNVWYLHASFITLSGFVIFRVIMSFCAERKLLKNHNNNLEYQQIIEICNSLEKEIENKKTEE